LPQESREEEEVNQKPSWLQKKKRKEKKIRSGINETDHRKTVLEKKSTKTKAGSLRLSLIIEMK
jgi:hypothetical protein